MILKNKLFLSEIDKLFLIIQTLYKSKVVYNIFYSLLQINLRLILVSGKTKEFLFSPSDSAGDIAQHVFDNWPDGECTNYIFF